MKQPCVAPSSPLCVDTPSVPAVAITLHNIPSPKTSGIKSLLPGCLLVAAFAAMLGFTSTASATSIVNFVGNTTATILPSISSGLTFTGKAINVTTDGFGNSGVFSLGSLSIDTTKNFGSVRNTASLNLNLVGASSMTVDTFDTQISNYFNGFYWNHDNYIFGNVGYTLANPGSPTAPVLFSYTDAGGSGSFDLGIVGACCQFETLMGTGDNGWKAIYGSSGSPGSDINVQITNARYTPSVAATPEPSSLVLLGTGILGFAGILRHRFAV